MSEHQNTPTGLFHAYSVTDEFPHRGGQYDGVRITWFMERRDKLIVSPSDVISDYFSMDDHDRAYAEDYIGSLFTHDEVLQLRGYLSDQGDRGEFESRLVKFPVQRSDGLVSVGAMAVGGSDDFYMLNEEDEYSLPFKVWGYYDVHGCRNSKGEIPSWESLQLLLVGRTPKTKPRLTVVADCADSILF